MLVGYARFSTQDQNLDLQKVARKGVRPKVMDDKKVAMATSLLNDSNHSIDDVCKILNISRPTLY